MHLRFEHHGWGMIEVPSGLPLADLLLSTGPTSFVFAYVFAEKRPRRMSGSAPGSVVSPYVVS